jgi:hypothetical protein
MFLSVKKPGRGIPLLLDGEVVCGNEINGFFIAKPDTLGLSTAKIAFKDFFIDPAIIHGAKRAYADTGPTSDAQILIHGQKTIIRVPRYGLDRADILAWRILTLLADHRHILTFVFPFNNSNPASGGIGYPVMHNRTNQFTQAAAGTFLVVNKQNILHCDFLSAVL